MVRRAMVVQGLQGVVGDRAGSTADGRNWRHNAWRRAYMGAYDERWCAHVKRGAAASMKESVAAKDIPRRWCAQLQINARINNSKN